MKYKRIPGTLLSPSVIALGTADFGSTFPASIAFQLLDLFVEKGGNFIDTAHIYGAWVPDGMGLSEKIIGQWMKERNIRDRVIIGTKGAHPMMETMDISRVSPQEIIADLDESLHSLQTETIDLYWLHRDDLKQPVGDLLEMLNDQVRAGKIRYFGCSNWHVARIVEAHQYATEHHIAGFVGNQLMWSLAEPDLDAVEDKTLMAMDAQMLDFHRKTGLAIAAYTPLARGFFTKAAHSPASLNQRLKAIYFSDENRKRLERAQKVAEELSLSLTSVVLAYLLNQSVPTFPVFACSNTEQLLENIAASTVAFGADVVGYLEKGS